MAERLLLTILEISIASSPVILLVLLISPLVGKRYGSNMRCLVWIVLAARLIIPFNMPWQHAIQLNLFSLPETQSAQYELFLPNPVQIIEQEIDADNQNTPTERERSRYIPITPVSLAALIWAAGAVLFLLYHIGAYFYTLHRLRRWSTPIQDEETLCRFAAVKKELSIKNEIKFYKSSKAESPLLLGFARTMMILPDKPLTEEQLDFMLHHELWHLKRRDLWYKLLMLLANAVHWFNPLVWFMERRASLDTELACDTDVLRGADCGKRTAYGYTILTFMEQGWRCKTPLTSRFYGGKKQMKQRFYNITDTSSKKRGTVVFCTLAIIIALSGCAVYANSSDEQTSQAQTQTPGPELLYIREKPDAETSTETEKATLETAQLIKRLESVTARLDSVNAASISVFVSADSKVNVTVSIIPEQGKGLTLEEKQGIVNLVAGAMPDVNADNISVNVVDDTPAGFAWPVNGGFIVNGLNSYLGHTGVDIGGVKEGTPVYAAESGTVVKAHESNVGYGKHIIIDHGNGFQTLYAHNSALHVNVGDVVAQGQAIAAVGRSGSAYGYHLHFEIRYNGKILDPTDFVTEPSSQADYATEGNTLDYTAESNPVDYADESNPLDYAEYDLTDGNDQYISNEGFPVYTPN